MIIKATRLQACMGARRGGGKSKRSPPPPFENKKSFLAILGALLLLFLHTGNFLLRFSHFWGPFHHVGAFLLLFTSWWGPFFGLAPSPPPPPTKMLAPMIARMVREHAPGIFLCDRNLVSSGHVLLRYCLKNDNNNNKL